MKQRKYFIAVVILSCIMIGVVVYAYLATQETGFKHCSIFTAIGMIALNIIYYLELKGE